VYHVFAIGDCAVNLSGCRLVLREFDFSFDYDIFFRLLRAVHFIIVPLGLSGKIAVFRTVN